MEYFFGLVIVLFCFSIETEGRRKWDIVPDPQNSEEVDLIHPVAPNARMTYNDEKSRMTVIHDTGIRSCFLTNYDPEWNLSDEEKQQIAKKIPRQIISSPIEFIKFKSKVGDVISEMCRRHSLYWMTRPEVPPKPKLHSSEETHHDSAEHDHPPHRPPHPPHPPRPHHEPVNMPPHPPRPHHGSVNMPPHPPRPHHEPANMPPHSPHSQEHHAKSPVDHPVPFIIHRDSRGLIAPGDDVADHYIVPPKKH